MKLGKIGSIFSSLMYTDRLSVYKYTTSENADGTTKTTREEVPVIADTPCRISFKSKDSSGSSNEMLNKKRVETIIFCDLGVNVDKGDKLVAKRIGDDGTVLATYEGLAGLPNVYVSHKEIVLLEVGEA